MPVSKSDLVPSPTIDERGYHHGDLRRALVAATVQLIEARGLEGISVRAVARHVGVSPAAPFRHFDSRTALLNAVAEEAQDRLLNAVEQERCSVADDDPIATFHAIGAGFLRWAFANPTHFQVISTRAVIDYDSPALRQRNDALRETMRRLLDRAAEQGQLREGEVGQHVLGGRALAYGLARMNIDGQFASWGVDPANALSESLAILDQFICGIRAPGPSVRPASDETGNSG